MDPSKAITEMKLLKRISGALKTLDKIDLAIEVDKKLGNILAVQNYYNLWMCKYSPSTEKGCNILSVICNNAI
jgi:hypothetical protein